MSIMTKTDIKLDIKSPCDVYKWMFMAEEHAEALASQLPQCTERAHGCTITPKLIQEFDACPDVGFCKTRPLDAPAVLVAAYYPPADANLEFTVTVSTYPVIRLIMVKPRGVDWVPLVTKTQFVDVPAGHRIEIMPKPEKLLILAIEPYGRSMGPAKRSKKRW